MKLRFEQLRDAFQQWAVGQEEEVQRDVAEFVFKWRKYFNDENDLITNFNAIARGDKYCGKWKGYKIYWVEHLRQALCEDLNVYIYKGKVLQRSRVIGDYCAQDNSIKVRQGQKLENEFEIQEVVDALSGK